jgi:hypothetical protein
VDWWNLVLASAPKEYKRCIDAVLIYTAWNLWKERNRRIFENASAARTRVMALTLEEIKLRALSCGGGLCLIVVFSSHVSYNPELVLSFFM